MPPSSILQQSLVESHSRRVVKGFKRNNTAKSPDMIGSRSAITVVTDLLIRAKGPASPKRAVPMLAAMITMAALQRIIVFMYSPRREFYRMTIYWYYNN
jgi:hypothetical protein